MHQSSVLLKTLFLLILAVASVSNSYGSSVVESGPSATITTIDGASSAFICDGDSVTLKIELTGMAPWRVEYWDGNGVTEVDILSSPYTFSVTDEDIYNLISVYDNFGTCGNISGIVDVTKYETPTAHIDGDALVCEGEATEVAIDLTGTAPWTIIYTNGTDSTTVTTSTNPYNFTTDIGIGEYELLSVADANCNGTVTGSAVISIAEKPTAFISGNLTVCEGNTGDLTMNLTGTPPWDIVYTNGSENFNFTSDESLLTFTTAPGSYELVSVTDAYCSGTVSGTGTISTTEPPTATIEGNSTICTGETADVTISLTGTGPWMVEYSDGSKIFNLESDENSVTVGLGVGNHELVSVTDANCTGTVGGSAIISGMPSPTASISGNSTICEGENAEATIQLTGTGPWTIVYSDGEENNTIISENNSYPLTVGAGTYELVSVLDANCSGTVSGTATITSVEAPTAIISGSTTICDGETATVAINLNGTAPWTFIYTDGAKNEEITTSESTYTLEKGSGDYELVSVSDASVCTGSVSGTASIDVGGLSGSVNLEDSYCFSDSEIELASSISNSNYTYRWTTTGLGNFSNADNSTTAYTISPDDNEIAFTLTVTNSCGSTVMEASTEIIYLDASFNITPGPNNREFVSQLEYEFSANITDADSYLWNFNDGTTADVREVVHTFEETGVVEVKLTVDKNGCSEGETGEYVVIGNNNLFVPNVFSPLSQNAENNKVKVYGENISPQDFSFEIYNRWGLVVYETSSLAEAQNTGWNGTVENREKENNVFTYILRGQFNNGKNIEQTGTITLVR